MKKTLLLLLAVICLGSLAVNAATTKSTTSTDSTTSTTTKPKFERMGPPPQDGNFANRPTPPKGAPKDGQQPRKKPDGKPGGDRIPPEFMQNSNTSTTK